MTLFAIIVVAALLLVALLAWLMAEINADRKWRNSMRDDMTGPQDRLPPKDAL